MRYNGWVYRHPNTPCKECVKPKRHLGCHDHCEEYQAARAEYENIKNAARANKKANEELDRYLSEQITKTLRRKK